MRKIAIVLNGQSPGILTHEKESKIGQNMTMIKMRVTFIGLVQVGTGAFFYNENDY